MAVWLLVRVMLIFFHLGRCVTRDVVHLAPLFLAAWEGQLRRDPTGPILAVFLKDSLVQAIKLALRVEAELGLPPATPTPSRN
jgi:hypothetical protein